MRAPLQVQRACGVCTSMLILVERVLLGMDLEEEQQRASSTARRRLGEDASHVLAAAKGVVWLLLRMVLPRQYSALLAPSAFWCCIHVRACACVCAIINNLHMHNSDDMDGWMDVPYQSTAYQWCVLAASNRGVSLSHACSVCAPCGTVVWAAGGGRGPTGTSGRRHRYRCTT
jgi:hypothetical protein